LSDLNYDRRGSGTPLVLVHGIGSRWQIWEPLLDELAKHRDVISVDLPGFGSSPFDSSISQGVLGYTDRLVAFFDELGLDRPEVGGNSMGGGIALELGRRGRASRVTAFSPVGFWNSPELRWNQLYFKSLHATGTRLRPVIPAIVQNRVGRTLFAGILMGKPAGIDPTALYGDALAALDSSAFFAALESFKSYDIRDPAQDWGALRDIPVTIAWGSRDQLLVHRTQSARAREALPWARHVTLKGAGHVPFYDDPVACVNVLV
jgi:pimeloyl-ACP methyl ester carboxylesterase